MLTPKEIKKKYTPDFQQNPQKYYPVDYLKERGFVRCTCSKCKRFFWSTHPDKEVCGDVACEGSFSFQDQKTKRNELDYIGTWKTFSKIMKQQGYTPIPRYPVAARWRDDIPFVEASIDNFIPYVVDGVSAPPANPLVVPQPSLRFNDVDNVGITGAHYTAFVMIGQHAFVPAAEYKQTDYFQHLLTWFEKGVGLKTDELTIHEDVWAGSGNFGPSLEFFSGGLELANQVYMQFRETPVGKRDLNLKVLDMGMGHERIPWFTQRKSTSYETTFPTVLKKLKARTGIDIDEDLRKKFLPYCGLLNADEAQDLQKVWQTIAKKIGTDTEYLKKTIRELEALFSVAEHSRTLLFALNDGCLPSNVGGGYNLRLVLRRALAFINNYGWDIDLPEVCNEHAEFLKEMFPELREKLDNVKLILDEERDKFNNTLEKSKRMVARIITKEKVTPETLLTLYDSQGINPEIIQEQAKELGKKIDIPDNFYGLVAERHKQQTVAEWQTKKEEYVDIEDVEPTAAMYFEDYEISKFDAKVLKVHDDFVILDRSFFYPTSGGQIHDVGKIENEEVIDVFKQGPVIIHKMKQKSKLKQGTKVSCNIDSDRRLQLTQHHTATHIINAAAKHILGSHIYQAGARKTLEKATLDITHFKKIESDELKKIEDRANQIVKEDIPVRSIFKDRAQAEKDHGMSIYQGGAVPGKQLRIVEIPEVDVEACGGTHVKHTKEVGQIKIIKSSKIQDGIVRLEYVAGKAADQIIQDEAKLTKDLGIPESELEPIASLFDVQIADVSKTIDRFTHETNDFMKQIVVIEKESDQKPSRIKLPSKISSLESAKSLFTAWKESKKRLDTLQQQKSKQIADSFKDNHSYEVDLDIKSMRTIVESKSNILLINKEGSFVTNDSDKFKKLVSLGAKGGGQEIKQGKIDPKQISKAIK